MPDLYNIFFLEVDILYLGHTHERLSSLQAFHEPPPRLLFFSSSLHSRWSLRRVARWLKVIYNMLRFQLLLLMAASPPSSSSSSVTLCFFFFSSSSSSPHIRRWLPQLHNSIQQHFLLPSVSLAAFSLFFLLHCLSHVFLFLYMMPPSWYYHMSHFLFSSLPFRHILHKVSSSSFLLLRLHI